jgi:dipeptidyl aminopeptidase/acylaminoacyl peptidase
VPHLWRVNVDASELAQLSSGSGEEPVAVSPDGRQLLFIRTEAPRELWIVSVEGGEPRKLVDDYVEEAAFSPDGRSVAYVRIEEREGRVVPVWIVVPLEGGAPTASLRTPPRSRYARWLPDGSGFSFIDASGQSLQRITVNQEISSVFRVPEGQIVWYQWMKRDSRSMFLVVRKGQVSNIWKWTAGTPGPVAVTDFRIGNIFDFALSPDESRMVFTQGIVNRETVLIREVEPAD